jgi:cupin fold WbuC family metalloprotein
MRWTSVKDEVFYADESPVRVSRPDIDELVRLAHVAGRRRSRLCAHPDAASRVHEMIIVHERDTYVRPHKHIDKSESFHVIAGRGDVVLLRDDGSVRDIVNLTSYEEGGCFYYRLHEPLFHTLVIRSDVIVFHETTNGPFVREETVFPEWAPAESDPDGICRYRADFEVRIRDWETMRRHE